MELGNVFFEILRELTNITKAAFDLDEDGAKFLLAILTIIASIMLIWKLLNPGKVKEAEEAQRLYNEKMKHQVSIQKPWNTSQVICFVFILSIIIKVATSL